MRYGVTGRRKRNMRRVGQLQALREQRRTYRASAGNATITASSAAPSGALVIEAKGIGKSYGDRPIVSDFSIRIQRGDRIGIVGPNGSGKTTLISMLTGVLPPDTGSVRLGSTLEIAALDQHRDSLDPECHRRRGADRRSRRHRHGQRQRQARHRLHEGLSVRERAGAHAAPQIVGRRTRPPHAGAGARQAVEPSGARRADQRSRYGDAGRAGGDAGRISRHGSPHQPRSRFSRSSGERGDRAGGQWPLGRICRRLQRHAGAARRRSDAAESPKTSLAKSSERNRPGRGTVAAGETAADVQGQARA